MLDSNVSSESGLGTRSMCTKLAAMKFMSFKKGAKCPVSSRCVFLGEVSSFEAPPCRITTVLPKKIHVRGCLIGQLMFV